MLTLGNQIDNCVVNAWNKMFNNNGRLNMDEIDVHIWTTYPKTTKGITKTYTLVVVSREYGDVCVYNNMSFSYHIRQPSKAFWHSFSQQNLPEKYVSWLSE